MAVITTGKEQEEFVKECTPWGDDGCVKFKHNNVQGLFRDVPEFSGKTWAVRMLTEPQDWVSTALPDSFPAKAVGNFCFLVENTLFSQEHFPNCLAQDFLSPWDFNPHYTRWYEKQTEHGKMKQGLSIHGKHRNIRRYITYFADKNMRPLSNVLFQYLVSAPGEKVSKATLSTTPARKRKSAPVQMVASSSEPQESPMRDISKRRKSEFQCRQVVKVAPTKKTPVQRKKKEEKPLNPSPPVSESSVNAPAVPETQEDEENTAPIVEELENQFNNLKQVIADTKKRYCTLTNPREMSATNDKIIRFVKLENEIKSRVESLVESTRYMTEDILNTPIMAQGPIVVKQEPI